MFPTISVAMSHVGKIYRRYHIPVNSPDRCSVAPSPSQLHSHTTHQIPVLAVCTYKVSHGMRNSLERSPLVANSSKLLSSHHSSHCGIDMRCDSYLPNCMARVPLMDETVNCIDEARQCTKFWYIIRIHFDEGMGFSERNQAAYHMRMGTAE